MTKDSDICKELGICVIEDLCKVDQEARAEGQRGFPEEVQQLSVSEEEVPPEQQERSCSVKQEVSEPLSIKEEPEELWSSQEGEQHQGPEEADDIKFTFDPELVKIEDDEENSCFSELDQKQTEEMEAGADGEHCGEPGADRSFDQEGNVQPETEEKTEDVSEAETDDSADWTETREDQISLDSEKKIKHKRPKTDNKLHSCFECGKKFKRKCHLSQHVRIHTGERPFSCSECGKSFYQKGNLKVHVRSHSEGITFDCSVCGKKFSHQGKLDMHVRIHTGERPFSCSECGKSFNQKGHLKAHVRTHSGEKPFDCSVCGKSFCHNSQLIVHMADHSGEKPFGCPVCGKRFNQKSYVNTHMRIHSGEKPFGCSVCGKSFYQKSNLRVHMRSHVKEKPL